MALFLRNKNLAPMKSRAYISIMAHYLLSFLLCASDYLTIFSSIRLVVQHVITVRVIVGVFNIACICRLTIL